MHNSLELPFATTAQRNKKAGFWQIFGTARFPPSGIVFKGILRHAATNPDWFCRRTVFVQFCLLVPLVTANVR